MSETLEFNDQQTHGRIEVGRVQIHLMLLGVKTHYSRQPN